MKDWIIWCNSFQIYLCINYCFELSTQENRTIQIAPFGLGSARIVAKRVETQDIFYIFVNVLLPRPVFNAVFLQVSAS